jgi:hypothetical protein
LAVASPAVAAEPIPVPALKAEMVERFTHFVDWPDDGLPAPDAPFVMCIFGGSTRRDPVATALEALARGRRIKERAVAVRYLAGANEAVKCQLVWVSGSETERLDALLAYTRWQPILTVADTNAFTLRGVTIVLRPTGKRIGFAINLDEANRSGLHISSRLLQLGTIVVTPPSSPEHRP